MPSFVTATVSEVLVERPGLQRVSTDAGRAYVLTDLVGPVAAGDRVVLNTTAVELSLGTGGWHVVHWNLARDAWSQPGAGHIMKLRYTSLQADTGAAEELHADLPADLDGLPVVAATLHSQVGVVAAVLRHLRPGASIAYVMTEGAALPLALSDLVADLRDRKVLDTTITAGHVVIVGMGPGVVGTGSALGTTAVEVAAVLDTVDALGGLGALCVRASEADGRDRHRGISHHVHTVLGLVRSHPIVPVPPALLSEARSLGDGATVEVVDGPGVGPLLDGMGLRITSMGRGPADDPLFYAAAGAAAGWAAARIPA